MGEEAYMMCVCVCVCVFLAEGEGGFSPTGV